VSRSSLTVSSGVSPPPLFPASRRASTPCS
jgi:hypothetical protein